MKIEEEIRLIKKQQNKYQEQIASIKANHLTTIYAILAFFAIRILGNQNIFDVIIITPEMAFTITYTFTSAVFYKETIIFAKSILKKGIGLK